MSFLTGSASVKGLAVIAVALLMLIPLGMLHGLVEERTAMRGEAVASVARGWGGRQLVGGPLLAVPVTSVADPAKPVTRDWYVLPEELEMEAALVVEKEPRRLGVYEVPVYTARIACKARFDIVRQVERLTAADGSVQVHPERARLLVVVSDLRGIRKIELPQGQVASGAIEPEHGFPVSVLAAPVFPEAFGSGGGAEFAMTFELAGTESLAFLPLARASTVRASGNWPHPGFASGFLPAAHRIDAKGFEARWRLTDLNRSFGARWFQGDITGEELGKSAFGVDLVQPVDLYQQVTRAVKYGGLFIGLSLLTLFLIESLCHRPLHPIQYGLMGLALSVFYLLLLALAEHIGFDSSYAVAGAALCALMGVYLAGALRSRRAGVAAGASFAGVYALLYLLVTSEDLALLAGALALFALLALLMLLTRRFDWYRYTPGTE